MPFVSSIVLALAASASVVSAHGYVSSIVINGQTFAGFDITSTPYKPDNQKPKSIGWSTTATDLGFVDGSSYTSGDIICHRSATNAQISANVTAGDKVSLVWNTWPTSHEGPIIDYMASCGTSSCETVDKSTLEFFKIAEKGLIDGSTTPGKFATDELLANSLTWTTTIPASLKPGNYVLRHEIIALHSAGQTNGAQNYPQCINLQVTGSGSDLPSGTKGTALYTPSDAGILVNIYQKLASYTIPGPALPAVFGGNASGGSSTGSTASSSAAAAATTTPAAAVAATPATTTTSAPAAAKTTAAAKSSCKKRRHARHVKTL